MRRNARSARENFVVCSFLSFFSLSLPHILFSLQINRYTYIKMMMKTTTISPSILSPSRRSRSSFKGRRSAFGEQRRGRIFCSRQDDDDFGHHHRMTTTKRKRKEKKKEGGVVCFSCADDDEEALLTTAGAEASTTSFLVSSSEDEELETRRASSSSKVCSSSSSFRLPKTKSTTTTTSSFMDLSLIHISEPTRPY